MLGIVRLFEPLRCDVLSRLGCFVTVRAHQSPQVSSPGSISSHSLHSSSLSPLPSLSPFSSLPPLRPLPPLSPHSPPPPSPQLSVERHEGGSCHWQMLEFFFFIRTPCLFRRSHFSFSWIRTTVCAAQRLQPSLQEQEDKSDVIDTPSTTS